MKTRTIALAAAFGALAVPASALADPPSPTERKNAAQECKFERGTTDATREAFRVKYGTNKNGKNAFGKCVSSRARDEDRENEAAQKTAVKDCKTEQAADPAAFRAKYQQKGNGIGKCVSQQAKANRQEADAEDREQAEARKNAAEQCDDERGETTVTREAFRTKYGTNANKSNAFGKCVSAKAKAQQEQEAQPTS